MFDIALSDDLATVFHWSNETPAWRELLRDVQRHPQMLVGVSDGGAHLDRDDGQEWSTQFLATWWRAEGVWRLEEAVRRITAVPAAVLGLRDRGVLAPGLARRRLRVRPRAHRHRHLPSGSRCGHRSRRGSGPFPGAIEATIVNGVVVVERGEPTGALPGQVVRPR